MPVKIFHDKSVTDLTSLRFPKIFLDTERLFGRKTSALPNWGTKNVKYAWLTTSISTKRTALETAVNLTAKCERKLHKERAKVRDLRRLSICIGLNLLWLASIIILINGFHRC